MASIYLVGIKGTGMCRLSIVLRRMGHDVSGCDSDTYFPTQLSLERENIHIDTGFDTPVSADIIIHSTAYPRELPVIRDSRCSHIYTYPEFLAYLSRKSRTFCVCGTHGKTTSCACASYLMNTGKRRDFSFYSIFGSEIQGSDGPVFNGTDNLLLEACEYQDHFLMYSVQGALVTNIDYDHVDYFRNEEDYLRSFLQFTMNIRQGGFLVLNMDDAGCRKLYRYIRETRCDLNMILYGFSERGPYRVERSALTGKYTMPVLDGMQFDIPFMERHLVLDVIGSCLLDTCILLDQKEPRLYLDTDSVITTEVFTTVLASFLRDAGSFPGTAGRSEKVLEKDGVVYIDDYAHHPAEITASLAEIRMRYPDRHNLVIFFPHTASRTDAFLDEFAHSLLDCDALIVFRTYGSARGDDDGGKSSRRLEKRISDMIMRRCRTRLGACIYEDDLEKLCDVASSWLKDGWICTILGAGSKKDTAFRIASRR